MPIGAPISARIAATACASASLSSDIIAPHGVRWYHRPFSVARRRRARVCWTARLVAARCRGDRMIGMRAVCGPVARSPLDEAVRADLRDRPLNVAKAGGLQL